uniref:Uncharacterized protein n=1 Tax=Arcella intermedia TaxID=1963864 RepID=A0A6B2LKF5_9EUKA
MEVAKYLVECGVDKNATSGKEKYTALHLAAFHNCRDMVQYLLEINCDITENSLGQTPLALAQEEEHKELYSLFKEELPPPILAIQNDDIQGIVKYLDNGNVNFTYQHQKTLLHHAAEKGRLQMVQILIQKSCLLSPVDEMNYTPLYYAALNQQYDVFKPAI